MQRIANNTNTVWIIIGIFLLFYTLSLLGYYVTPIESAAFLILAAGTLILSIIRIEYGFSMVIFEFFAGHGGHLFEFLGISIRFTLFLIVICVWLYKKAREVYKKQSFSLTNVPIISLLYGNSKNSYTIEGGRGNWFPRVGKQRLRPQSEERQKPRVSGEHSSRVKRVTMFFVVFLFFIFIGAIRGMAYNEPRIAISDFINYSYIFLVFPFIDILKKNNVFKNIVTISKAGIISIGIVTIAVFILFSTGIMEVHDSFYWWWRNTVIGKATFAGNNFYRIVSPAHLLIMPLFLVVLSFLIEPRSRSYASLRGMPRYRKKFFVALALISSIIIIINFSRAYFLGIGAGLIVLAYHIHWRRWLVFSLIVLMLMLFEFSVIYGLVSGGKIFEGLGFVSSRAQTVVSPEEELSSRTRMAILPHLIEKIKAEPVFGNGLGSTVTFVDPLTNKERTTFHLDWGYLEIITELGLITLILYADILFLIFYTGLTNIGRDTESPWSLNIFQKRLTIGLLAGLSSIIVSTLFGPFLFHPMGIFYITLTTAIVSIHPRHYSYNN